MQAAGVAGGKVGSPRVSRPMLKGWKQSTSLPKSMELMTTESDTCAGKGRRGRMPETAGSSLRLRTAAMTAASLVSAGRVSLR